MSDSEKYDALTPTQQLVIEVLAARYRTDERTWTFSTNVRTQVKELEKLGYIGWKSGIVDKTILVWLTDLGKTVALSDNFVTRLQEKYENLLGSIWLYINWHNVTRQLTTPQKELFADGVDASSQRMADDDPNWTPVATRWWRDDYVDPTAFPICPKCQGRIIGHNGLDAHLTPCLTCGSINHTGCQHR